MKKYINGNIVEMTPEEVAAMEQAAQNMPAPEPTPEERITELEKNKADRSDVAAIFGKIDAAYQEGVDTAYDNI